MTVQSPRLRLPPRLHPHLRAIAAMIAVRVLVRVRAAATPVAVILRVRATPALVVMIAIATAHLPVRLVQVRQRSRHPALSQSNAKLPEEEQPVLVTLRTESQIEEEANHLNRNADRTLELPLLLASKGRPRKLRKVERISSEDAMIPERDDNVGVILRRESLSEEVEVQILEDKEEVPIVTNIVTVDLILTMQDLLAGIFLERPREVEETKEVEGGEVNPETVIADPVLRETRETPELVLVVRVPIAIERGATATTSKQAKTNLEEIARSASDREETILAIKRTSTYSCIPPTLFRKLVVRKIVIFV